VNRGQVRGGILGQNGERQQPTIWVVSGLSWVKPPVIDAGESKRALIASVVKTMAFDAQK